MDFQADEDASNYTVRKALFHSPILKKANVAGKIKRRSSALDVAPLHDTTNIMPPSEEPKSKKIKLTWDPEIVAILKKQNLGGTTEKAQPVKKSVVNKRAGSASGKKIKLTFDPEVNAILKKQQDCTSKTSNQEAKKAQQPTVVLTRPSNPASANQVRKTLFKGAKKDTKKSEIVKRKIQKKSSIQGTPAQTPKISKRENSVDPLSLTAAKKQLASARFRPYHDPSPTDSFQMLEDQCRSVKKSVKKKPRVRPADLQIVQESGSITSCIQNLLTIVADEREEMKRYVDKRYGVVEKHLKDILGSLDGEDGVVVAVHGK